MKNFNREVKFDRRDSGKYRKPSIYDFRKTDRFDERGPSRFSRREPPQYDRREARRPNLEMHKVTCDNCGEKCEVPFKPNNRKPVYCSNCYQKNERSETRKPDQLKQKLDQINEKLDRILKSLKL